MTGQIDSDDANQFSPEEMEGWLKLEIKQVRLASARRIKEASAIVQEYVSGRLTQTEANRSLEEFETKWGEVANDLAIASEIHDEAVNAIYGLKDRHRDRKSSGPRSR